MERNTGIDKYSPIIILWYITIEDVDFVVVGIRTDLNIFGWFGFYCIKSMVGSRNQIWLRGFQNQKSTTDRLMNIPE